MRREKGLVQFCVDFNRILHRITIENLICYCNNMYMILPIYNILLRTTLHGMEKYIINNDFNFLCIDIYI